MRRIQERKITTCHVGERHAPPVRMNYLSLLSATAAQPTVTQTKQQNVMCRSPLLKRCTAQVSSAFMRTLHFVNVGYVIDGGVWGRRDIEEEKIDLSAVLHSSSSYRPAQHGCDLLSLLTSCLRVDILKCKERGRLVD